MPWPQATDYYEAIQTPSIAFKDADLRAGQPALNALGMPLPCSGNFADVYQVHGADGRQHWAVKCFTREVPDRERRFAAISQYLERKHLPFMVDFRYVADGILIRGLWYPILKMRWVEGVTLGEFVRTSLGRPPLLQGLAKLWRRLAHELREAGLAHGDLQHGNVLLVRSRAGKLGVRLIDYDGMYVPALATVRSGEVGHPNFQHPQRLRDGVYNFELDRFAHLVIYTALRTLAAHGSGLWDRYDNSDNLLFRESDLADPAASPLFRELLQSYDANVATLASQLLLAARGDLRHVPLLTDIVNDGDCALPLSTEQTRELQRLLSQAGPLRAAPARAPMELELKGTAPAVSWQSAPPPVRVATAAAAAPSAVATVVQAPVPVRQSARPARSSYRSPGMSPLVLVLAICMPIAAVTLFVVVAILLSGNGGASETRLVEVPRVSPSVPTTPPPPAESGLGRPTFPSADRGNESGQSRRPSPPLSSSVAGGRLVATFDHRITDGTRPARIRSVLFLEHGEHGVSLGEDGSLRCWDLKSNREHMMTGLGSGNGKAYSCMALSPLRDRLLVGHEGGLMELDLKGYRGLKPQIGFHAVVTAPATHVGYVIDGTGSDRVALIGGPNVLERWDLDRKVRLTMYDTIKLGHAPFVITPTGEVVLQVDPPTSGAYETLMLRRLSDMKEVQRLSPVQTGIAHLAIDHAGHRVASGASNRVLTVWDLPKSSYTQYTSNDNINAVAINGSGTRAATVADSGTLRTWDLTGTGNHLALGGHVGAVRAVAFAPDGKHILTGGDDGAVRLWRLDN